MRPRCLGDTQCVNSGFSRRCLSLDCSLGASPRQVDSRSRYGRRPRGKSMVTSAGVVEHPRLANGYVVSRVVECMYVPSTIRRSRRRCVVKRADVSRPAVRSQTPRCLGAIGSRTVDASTYTNIGADECVLVSPALRPRFSQRWSWTLLPACNTSFRSLRLLVALVLLPRRPPVLPVGMR